MDVFLETYLSNGWLSSNPTHPSIVVERFFREVENGDSTKILQFLPHILVSQVGARKLETIFALNTDEVRKRGGIREVEVLNEWGDTDVAAVEVNMTYGNGSKDYEVVLLCKENNEWKIDMSR
jgi:hypothetical protein